MPANTNNVFKWMKSHIFNSENGIETATQLAEEAADHFKMWEALDDPDHWIWDCAAATMEWFETSESV